MYIVSNKTNPAPQLPDSLCPSASLSRSALSPCQCPSPGLLAPAQGFAHDSSPEGATARSPRAPPRAAAALPKAQASGWRIALSLHGKAQAQAQAHGSLPA